jgi:hypothetical protein
MTVCPYATTVSALFQAQGGPALVHDLAMACDPDEQIIYVFGGEIHPYSFRKELAKHYGAFYAYHIIDDRWERLS